MLMEPSGFVMRTSFLAQLSSEEYTHMIDQGQAPVLDQNKVALFTLTAKVLEYAAKVFFVFAVGFVAANMPRNNIKYIVGFILSLTCFLGSSHMARSLHGRTEINKKFEDVQTALSKASTAQERLNALSQYWENAKPAKDNNAGIISLQSAAELYDLDVTQRCCQLRSAFYAAMADLHDQPIHTKRFEDIFILQTPTFSAYPVLTMTTLRTGVSITSLSLKNPDNDLQKKVSDIGEACFKFKQPEYPSDSNLKSYFMDVLKQVKIP